MNHVRVEAERSIKSAVVSNPPAAHKGEGSISACLKVVRQRLSPIGDSSPTDFRRLGFSRHGEDKFVCIFAPLWLIIASIASLSPLFIIRMRETRVQKEACRNRCSSEEIVTSVPSNDTNKDYAFLMIGLEEELLNCGVTLNTNLQDYASK